MLKFISPIESPYRIDMFNQMTKYEVPFFTYFLSSTRPGRSWTRIAVKKFPHRTLSKESGWLGGYYYKLPYAIIKDFCLGKDTWIIGASWNNLITIILLILNSMLPRTEVLLWIELNEDIDASKPKFQLFFRNLILSSCSGLVVPNKPAQEYISRGLFGQKKFLVLPNFIDTDRFNPKLQIVDKDSYILIPARLIEERKGQIRFFKNLGTGIIRRHNWILLGNGKDEEAIRKYCSENKLNNISIVPFVEYDEVVNYYEGAKGFVLPSLHDPSPLALIEAASMGLPLLVSQKCGNSQDFVRSTNGIEFNPLCKTDVREAWSRFERLMTADTPRLERRVVHDYTEVFREFSQL